jgi:hypothetical protein
MNGPTKTVGPPLTPLPPRKSRGVLEKVEKVLDNADDVIDGMWPETSTERKANLRAEDSTGIGSRFVLFI